MPSKITVSLSDNTPDVISLDVPLLIRLLEYAREDAKSDMDLHFLSENLIRLSADKVLTMADYDSITTLSSESSTDVKHFILVVADSIEKLRKQDVHRALESAGKHKVELAHYILANRPDLGQELDEVMHEEFDLVDWRNI
jgi:hypothetical protein